MVLTRLVTEFRHGSTVQMLANTEVQDHVRHRLFARVLLKPIST